MAAFTKVDDAVHTAAAQLLDAANTKTLRLVLCDTAAIRRVRAVRVPPTGVAAWCAKLGAEGIGLTTAIMAFAAQHDGVVPGGDAAGCSAVGEIRMVPDWSTLVALPWCPGHAFVHVWLRHRDGSPWALCPRAALRRALDALAAQTDGYALRVGFESEFMLLDPKRGHAPVDTLWYCASRAFDQQADVLDAMCAALEGCGVAIEQFHPECAHGQYEIVTTHYPALEAVDKLLLTREAIAGVAHRHGLLATFAPKVVAGMPGNGSHCHFSLNTAEGKNLFSETVFGNGKDGGPTFHKDVEGFLAGVLRALSGVLPFTAPSPNSFRRLVPSCWSGCFACWGVDNREAPLRLATAPGPGGASVSSNAELKLFDASAQPHVGVAALVAAGLHGVRAGLALPPKVDADPALLDPRPAGVVRLPTSVEDAFQKLAGGRQGVTGSAAANQAVVDLLGAELVAVVRAVRHSEHVFFKGKELAEEAEVLLERY